MTRPVAALTGASGFLGRRLAWRLDQAGWRVRALVRRPLDRDLWQGPAPELVHGDLADRAALARLVDGAVLVIHCAGVVSARTRADFFAANAGGARNVAEATAATPDARLVLVSSLAAREPQLSDYAASKRAGEDAALSALAPGRIAVVRPPAIYGPGDRATLDIFKLAARAPILPVLDEPAARLALIHVDDAAAGVLGEASRPGRKPVAALGGDRPSGYSWREIMTAAGEAVGRRPRLMPIAPWLLSAAAQVSDLAAKLGGAPAMLTPGKAREMRHLDWSVAADELASGHTAAHFGLQAGFSDAVAWYRERGWL